MSAKCHHHFNWHLLRSVWMCSCSFFLKKRKKDEKKEQLGGSSSWPCNRKHLWRSLTRVNIRRNLEDDELPNSCWSCIYRCFSLSSAILDVIYPAWLHHTKTPHPSVNRQSNAVYKTPLSNRTIAIAAPKVHGLRWIFVLEKRYVDEERGTLKASNTWAEVQQHVSDPHHCRNVREDPLSCETQSFLKTSLTPRSLVWAV